MAKGKKTAEQTLKRYLWLLGVLYNAGKQGLTLDELNKLWQTNELSSGELLSLDTYNKHRVAIKEIFKIKIVCNNRRRSIEFTPGRGIGAVRRDMVNAIAVNNLISRHPDLWLKIQYDDFEHEKRFMLPILEVISKKKMIAIDYLDGVDSYKRCIFVPLFLKSIRQRWYLFGCEYDNDEYDPTVIALDCIKKIHSVGMQFKDTFGSIEEFVAKHFSPIPIFHSLSEHEVQIKVYGGLIEHLKQFPLHHTQIMLDEKRGYSVLGYDLIPDDYFIGEIFRYGDRIEVIEPESLRKEVITRIEKMRKCYLEIK